MRPMLAMGDLATPVLLLMLLTVDGMLLVALGLLALSARKRSLLALVIASIFILVDGYLVITNIPWAHDAFCYPLNEQNYQSPDLIFWCRIAAAFWVMAIIVVAFCFIRVIQKRRPKERIQNAD